MIKILNTSEINHNDKNKCVIINNSYYLQKSLIVKIYDNHIICYDELKSYTHWLILENNHVKKTKKCPFSYEEISIWDILDNKEVSENYTLANNKEFAPIDVLTHQNNAYNFFKDKKIGFILGDMGIGKTKIYFDWLNNLLENDLIDRVVYFTPPTVIGKLKLEAKRWLITDEIDFISCHLLSSKAFKASNLKINDRVALIFDESHRFKNYDASMTKNALLLSEMAIYKMIGTGTPIPNNPLDIASQGCLLSPELFELDNLNHFSKKFIKRGDGGRVVGMKNLVEVFNSIIPYTKIILHKDIDSLDFSKTKIQIAVSYDDDFNKFIRNGFELIKDDMLFSADGIGALMRVRSLFAGIINKKDDESVLYNGINAKIEVLKDLLEDIPVTDKIIIWVNLHKEIDDVVDFLESIKEPYSLLHGNLSQAKTDSEIFDFRHGPNRFLVATQATGGTGLDLFEANHSIYLSNSFNLQDREQSMGRINRIGQSKPIFYYDLVYNKSIDGRILASLERKGNLQDDFKTAKDVIKAVEEELYR